MKDRPARSAQGGFPVVSRDLCDLSRCFSILRVISSCPVAVEEIRPPESGAPPRNHPE